VLYIKNELKTKTTLKYREDIQHSEAVREVYEELDLKGKFMEFEEESFEWLKKEIPKINNGIPHKIFHDYTYGVFKRRPE